LNPASGEWAVPQKAFTALDIYPGLEQFAREAEQGFARGSEVHSTAIPFKDLDVKGVF